jgi:hypothetical protein
MFDSVTKQVHRHHIGQADRRGTAPEEPERALVAGYAIGFEELRAHHYANQLRHRPEVVVYPGAEAHVLAEETGRLLAIGRSGRVQRQLRAVQVRPAALAGGAAADRTEPDSWPGAPAGRRGEPSQQRHAGRRGPGNVDLI